MNRIIRMGTFTFLLGTLMVASVQAATYTAASCSESDVASALGKVSADGDIVSIPAGNCTWTTALSYTQKNSFTLQGAGAETPSGGTDQTIIQDDYAYTSGSGFINLNTIVGKSLRITGIAFYWSTSQSSVTNNGEIQIVGYSQAVRLDNCHFYQPSGATNGIVIAGIWNWVYGVADHNLIDMTSNDSNWIRVGMPSYDSDSEGIGNKSWADPTNFGSGNFFFLESNTFNWNGSTSNSGTDFGATNDCNAGGRMVLRHNTINGLFLTQMHEMEGDFRGCRAMEVYDNTFAGDGANPFATAFGTRMGTSLMWGNSLVGFKNLGQATNDRTNTGHGFGTATPVVAAGSTTGWGYCGTMGSGANQGPSSYDYSTSNPGYPCADQVGRGQSQLMSGTFPNKINSVTGTISWTANALEPVYVWDNAYTAPSGGGGGNGYFVSNDTTTIQENRDYYLELPNYSEPSATFNGKTGIGSGTLVPTNSGAYSGAPSCTPLVGYWDTTTSTLYQCTTANTWTAYYTPYTFPHPLVTTGTTIAPPTNVKAVAH